MTFKTTGIHSSVISWHVFMLVTEWAGMYKEDFYLLSEDREQLMCRDQQTNS